jgi:hypothetical protein
MRRPYQLWTVVALKKKQEQANITNLIPRIMRLNDKLSLTIFSDEKTI